MTAAQAPDVRGRRVAARIYRGATLSCGVLFFGGMVVVALLGGLDSGEPPVLWMGVVGVAAVVAVVGWVVWIALEVVAGWREPRGTTPAPRALESPKPEIAEGPIRWHLAVLLAETLALAAVVAVARRDDLGSWLEVALRLAGLLLVGAAWLSIQGLWNRWRLQRSTDRRHDVGRRRS